MIYCYNDLLGYGKRLCEAVNANKGSAMMISHAAQVPNEHESIVYVNFDGSDSVNRIYNELLEYENVYIIPEERVTSLSNNPINQHEVIRKKWVCSSWLLNNLRDAVGTIQKIIYPVVKYNSNGSKEIIESSEDAFKICAKAFDTKSAEKYLYLRSAVDSRDNEWFIFMLGKKYAFAAKVHEDKYQMINVMNEQHNELLKYAYAFMKDEDINWAAVKVICGLDKNKRFISPFIDNVYASFPMDWLMTGGMVFESDNGTDWESTGKPALRIFDFAAKMIIEGTI